MNIQQTSVFKRKYKKLRKHDKEVVDTGIREIMKNPSIGRFKKGDLLDHQVHKVTDKNREWLIAYIYGAKSLDLIDLGSHENFYRNLKKRLN